MTALGRDNVRIKKAHVGPQSSRRLRVFSSGARDLA